MTLSDRSSAADSAVLSWVMDGATRDVIRSFRFANFPCLLAVAGSTSSPSHVLHGQGTRSRFSVLAILSFTTLAMILGGKDWIGLDFGWSAIIYVAWFLYLYNNYVEN